jgi:hypothetical protein
MPAVNVEESGDELVLLFVQRTSQLSITMAS